MKYGMFGSGAVLGLCVLIWVINHYSVNGILNYFEAWALLITWAMSTLLFIVFGIASLFEQGGGGAS